MSYTETLQRSFRLLAFDEAAANELANDPGATGHGFLTLALTGMVSGAISLVFTMLFMPNLFMLAASVMAIVLSPILMIIGFIIGYSIYHFLAKIFGGQATGSQYFRTMSNVMYVSLLSNVPFGNMAVIPYLAIVNGFVLCKVHKLSVVRSVIVVLLPVAIIVGIAFLIGGAALMSYLSR
jgi:hypothetical protein